MIYPVKKTFLAALVLLCLPAAAEETGAAATPATQPDSATPDVSDSVPPYDWSLRAKEAFLATYRETCAGLDESDTLESRAPDIYDLKFRHASDEADMPDRVLTLYRFFCSRGAYNESHVFFMRTDLPEILPVSFAQPVVHVNYENEDFEGKVMGIDIIGLQASALLVNSEVDPAKNSISSFSKWRGVGDAASTGTWVLKDGQFVLSTFEVDASYDEEINPVSILDYRAINETLTQAP